MTDSPQYVAVKFRTSDARQYTYVNNGPPVQIDDVVKVPAPIAGDGGLRAIVSELVSEKPSFVCKSILGKVET